MTEARSASRTGPWTPAVVLGLCLLAQLGIASAVRGQVPARQVEAVPYRPAPPLRSYVAIRRMESSNERHKKDAWLVVRTELHEDGTFTYQVLDEGGSELIRNRVLREALDKEVQVHLDGRARRGGLTLDNYVFSAPASAGGLVRIALEPRRREDMLLKGALFTSPDGELLRVEGDLVKRPSFWTRSVRVVREYGRVAGAHVPLRLEMTAQVRIVGPSRLTMTYEYERINGRAVHEAPPVELPSNVTRVASRAPQP
jgi:hypothetical protein